MANKWLPRQTIGLYGSGMFSPATAGMETKESQSRLTGATRIMSIVSPSPPTGGILRRLEMTPNSTEKLNRLHFDRDRLPISPDSSWQSPVFTSLVFLWHQL